MKKKLVMHMKKILVMMIILIFCVLLVACNNNTQNAGNNNQEHENSSVQEEQNSEKEEEKINEKYDVTTEMKGIIESTRLGSLENIEGAGKVSKIDFSDLPGVTYEHVEEITDEEITEVWLIKMSNLNQYDKIVSKLKNSLEELKIKYADNKFITAILSNADNIIIQEQEGIVMAAFAPDAGVIISGIEQSFVEKADVP